MSIRNWRGAWARLHRDKVRGGGIAGALRYVTHRIRARVWRFVYAALLRYQTPSPPFTRNVGQIALLAARNYHPQSCAGRVVPFRVTEHRPGEPPDPFHRWDRVVLGELEIYEIGGDHMSLMRQPAVESVAKQLRSYMDRATSQEA